MKTSTYHLVVLIFGILSTYELAVQADTNSASGTGAGGAGPTLRTGTGGRKAKGKITNLGATKANPDTLHGVCTIVESPTNPFAGPCADVLLVLNDSNSGNEVAKTRTTAQGQFAFATEHGKTYKLTAGSKAYDVIAPSGVVHGGDSISLQLRQK